MEKEMQTALEGGKLSQDALPGYMAQRMDRVCYQNPPEPLLGQGAAFSCWQLLIANPGRLACE